MFLLILLVVSAGRLTGNAVRGSIEDLGTGDTTTFDDGTEVTIDNIDSNTGQVSGTLTTSSGDSQSFSLAEGQTSTAVGGIQIAVGDIGKGGLFGLIGAPEVPIRITPAPNLPTEGEGLDGVGCEFLEEEEAIISLGEGTFLNGHIVDLDEEGGLIVDETYSYPPLEDGGYYLVPIPNPECYWEASFNNGELYMITVCNVAEEFIGEEFVE